MLTCFDVAKYFLCCPEYDDPSDAISNLKLQKLLYFAQGHALAVLGRPLFRDDFFAWRLGPVIPAAYEHYKVFGSSAIEKPAQVDYKKFSNEEQTLLARVWSTYSPYSAFGLSELSHKTDPWKKHIGTESMITKLEMREFFKQF